MRNKHKLSQLPGQPDTYLDVSTVVAVRYEPGSDVPAVVLHTDQGFAVVLYATDGDTAKLMADVLSMVKSLK